MKKYLVLLIVALTAGGTAMAQDDDVYFVPSKSKKVETSSANTSETLRSSYVTIQNPRTVVVTDNNRNSSWDVDAYNRRGHNVDTTSYGDGVLAADDEVADGTCTSLIVRFHSPRAGIYISSPYYSLLTDYYWDGPWYTAWYDPFYYTGWYGWGGWPFYYGGPFHHYAYWHSPWWYGAGWHGAWWGWGADFAWGGWRAPHHEMRPAMAFRDGGRNSFRPSRDYSGNRNYMAARSTRNTPSGMGVGRNSGVGNGSNSSYRPSRSYTGNTSRSSESNTSRSGRSYSTPSTQSHSNSSMPSRSFSSPSGGGRSFGGPSGGGHSGGGGGRSFGGRR